MAIEFRNCVKCKEYPVFTNTFPFLLSFLPFCRVLMKSASPAFQQPLKYKERSVLHSKRSMDDRSDQSSVKSTDSNSFPSPCASPSPPSSGKVQYLYDSIYYVSFKIDIYILK